MRFAIAQKITIFSGLFKYLSIPLMSWSTRFDEPIRLDGKALHTLRDAAEHVIALPPKETKQAHWRHVLPARRRRETRAADVCADCHGEGAGRRQGTTKRAFTGRSQL